MRYLEHRCLLSVVAALFLLFAAAAPAQTPDNDPPANEGVCDELIGGTPGLYGLCIAFCEAQDCDYDLGALDPFADCSPADPGLLELYDEMKLPGDPEMPCVVLDSSCPCFTQEQVDAIPTPYDQCIIDFDFGSGGASLTTNIIHVQGTGAQATVNSFGGGSCIYADGFTDPPIFLFFETNTAQAQECRQIIVNTIEANEGQCELLCDPECP